MEYRIIEERGLDGKVFNYQIQGKFLFFWLTLISGYSTIDAAREAVSRLKSTRTVVS
jgi:hypothetical protein